MTMMENSRRMVAMVRRAIERRSRTDTMSPPIAKGISWSELPRIPELASFLICSLCLLQFAELLERPAAVVMGNGLIGLEGDGLVMGSQGIFVVSEFIERYPSIVKRFDALRIQLEGTLIGRQGFPSPPDFDRADPFRTI